MFIGINNDKENTIEILDTDFTAEYPVQHTLNPRNYWDIAAEIAIIKEYSKRKLNVAENLFLALIYIQKCMSSFSVQYFVAEMNFYLLGLQEYNNNIKTELDQYLQKYLLLE